VRRAAFYMMYAQLEDGTLCPTTMTYAVVPAIKRDAALASEWLPRIYSTEYDPRFLPPQDKRGVTFGMGMTKSRGGSDVRANTTRADPVGGREYRIVGHKWFFSAPMCDAFLILAQAPGGLSCFLLPRFMPDGEVNAIRLQRLRTSSAIARTRAPRSSSTARTRGSSARKAAASRSSWKWAPIAGSIAHSEPAA
jgi:putative acyl-CoA dehydrogenase